MICTTRPKHLLKVLGDLKILYTDLNNLIIEYDTIKEWEPTSFTSWEANGGYPNGIQTYQQCLYLCNWSPDAVLLYNSKSEKLKENLSFVDPCGIDIDEEKKLLYVADQSNLTILNLQLNFISSWILPSIIGFYRGIKINSNILYVTIPEASSNIFLCNPQDGKIINKYANSDHVLNNPRGITVNNKYIYVCDCDNHRFQILNKKNGNFHCQWGNYESREELGQFHDPVSVYYYIEDDNFYIGDSFSVQIFRKDSVCIQRIGRGSKLSWVAGICIINELLYVSDFNNRRIQIFRHVS